MVDDRADEGTGLPGQPRGNRFVIAMVNDLMLGVRIEGAAKAVGVSVEAVSSIEEAGEQLRSRAVDAVVIDLAIAGPDLERIVSEAHELGARVIGFYPHVNVGLRRAAQRAGIERVYPRSRFLRELPSILRESTGG